MIPKTIHYCWFGGKPLPPLYQKCLESWSHYLPDYRVVRWDETNVRIDTPFLVSCFQRKQWAFLSDYVRLRALWSEGGIYLDTDIEVVRPFDDLLGHQCFLGFEAPDRANTSVIGAIEGHWFLGECMRLMDLRHSQRRPYLIAPEVATRCILSGDPKTISVFPSEYFYPYNPYDESRPVKELMYSSVTEQTYAIHHWGKAWRQGMLSRVLKKLGL